MTRGPRRGKSGQWLARQRRDPYVRAAREAGLRARAVFKLEQIDRKYRLLKPDSLIIDIGAAPGSWSQYAAARVGGDGQVIAVDVLAMQPIAKVCFIRGDFTEDAVQGRVEVALAGRRADLVLSDMAPNISGIHHADQARAETLQHALAAFCRRGLRPGGALLTKLFAGEEAATTRVRLDACFESVRAIKPEASRAQSREVYLLARGYAGDDAGAVGKSRVEVGVDARHGVYLAGRARGDSGDLQSASEAKP